jgi:hypothetical protein
MGMGKVIGCKMVSKELPLLINFSPFKNLPDIMEYRALRSPKNFRANFKKLKLSTHI